MRNQIYIYVAVIGALTIATISGCKKFDEHKPEITAITINESNLNELMANAGAPNTMTIAMKDDRALSQVMIKFSTASGLHQHDHSGSEHVFNDYNQGTWDTVHVANISGTEFLKTFQFDIPNTVSGGWNLEVSVLDESGNLATIEETVHIINTFNPSVSISATNPTVSAEGIIYSTLDSIVSIEGIALDGDTLENITAAMYRGSAQVWLEEHLNLSEVLFDLSSFTEPSLTEEGVYYYDIEATDKLGFTTKVRATIHVN